MRVIHMLRKPLSEGTVAANTLKHGCGGLHIDASRISTDDNLNGGAYALNPTPRAGEDMWTRDRKGDTNSFKRGGAGRSALPGDTREGASAGMFQPNSTATSNFVQPTGRWPANVILQHFPECRCEGVRKVKGDKRGSTGGKKERGLEGKGKDIYAAGWRAKTDVAGVAYGDTEGNEAVLDWVCIDGCPVKRLDEQSGVSKSTGGRIGNAGGAYSGLGPTGFTNAHQAGDPGFGDTGGASRFFKQVGGNSE